MLLFPALHLQAPVPGVLAMVLLTTAIAIPMCFNETTFLAITSCAVVAMYAAYALPVAARIASGSTYFLPGPFYLGELELPII